VDLPVVSVAFACDANNYVMLCTCPKRRGACAMASSSAARDVLSIPPLRPRRAKLFCCPCWPARDTSAKGAAAPSDVRREKDSLLAVYGLDELSDTDGEGEEPENPLSPEQISIMLDRQIARTRELDIDRTIDSPDDCAASLKRDGLD
jgi:hypothetical protein